MLRASLLWLSEQPRVFRFVRSNGLARRLASRFVAGETVDSAVKVLRELNTAGISGTLDLLGEAVRGPAEARAARDTYLQALDRIQQTGADSNVSLKLTQMGLDIEEQECVANVRAIASRAGAQGSFVRIDMEGSAYTGRTLELFTTQFHPEFGNTVGVVLQSYLRRTESDVANMIALGLARLCRARARRQRTSRSRALRCGRRLRRLHGAAARARELSRDRHARPTHYRPMKAFATRRIPPARFEFQMLFGVRRDLQRALRRDGYRIRVYVPFGTQWYSYLMRRLAERPANIAFVLSNIVKESLRR